MSVTTHSAPARPGQAWGVAAVIASTIGVGISYGIGYPLTALSFEAWGAPAWLAGVAGSMPALAIFLLLPFFPALVGRVGAVPAMALGCVAVGTGFILMGLFPDVGAWLALRFLMGAGLALPWLVGETWINTVTSDDRRGRMIALYSIALFSGFAVGPVVLEQVGTTGWAPFLVGAAGVFLAVLPILLARRLAPELPSHPGTGLLGAARLVPAAMAGAFVGGLLEMSHFSLLTTYLVQGGTPAELALRLLGLLMVGGIVLQFGIGWLADRFSRQGLLVALSLVFAGLAAGLPAALSLDWAGPALLFLCGGILVGFYTLALAIIGEKVPARDLAVANAAFLVMYQAGAMVGPSVTGAAMSLLPPHGFVIAMAGAALLGAGAAWLAGRKG